MLLEQLDIDAGTIVKTFQIAEGDEFDQILIAGSIFGQQNQMIALIGTTVFELASLPGNVDFTTDNGLDPVFEGQVVKLNSSKQVAMIREG